MLSDENVSFPLTFCSVPTTPFWNDPSFLVKYVLCMDLICCSHSLMRRICWWCFGAPKLVIHFKASLSLRCGSLSYNCSRALTISPAPICFPLIDSYLRGSGSGTFQSAYVTLKITFQVCRYLTLPNCTSARASVSRDLWSPRLLWRVAPGTGLRGWPSG